ncbi:MAG: ROK family protein [Planctomycetota bacterium]
MSLVRRFLPAAEARPPFYAGIDLGGTNIKLGIVDDLGRPLSWMSIPTEMERGPEDAAERIGSAVRGTIEAAGLSLDAVAGVSLGLPGILDIPGGRIIKVVNLKGWDGFAIREGIGRHCGLPAVIANDADAAAFGEFWAGSGRGFRSMALITLGTGIGCGIVLGDRVLSGEHGFGGECGHLLIDCNATARMCGCGLRGHLEAYASATAVVQRTREALSSGRTSSLAQQIAAGAVLTPELLCHESEKGDALAAELIAETADYLAAGIVNIMHTIDPSGILLGGAMTFGGAASEVGRNFLDRIRGQVQIRSFKILSDQTVIDFATLGSDAGFIGAAGLARLKRGNLSCN